MKKFLLHILIFFAIVAVVDFVVGKAFYYLQSHAGGRTGAEWYACKESNEDIVIMGSSRASHHYVPELISEKLEMSCFNAGQDGNGIVLQYGRWKMLSKRYTPKMIIYDVNVSFDLAHNDNMTYIDRLKPFSEDDSIKDYVATLFPLERIKLNSNTYRYNYKFIEMATDCLKKSDFKSMLGYMPLYGHIRKDIVDRPRVIKSNSILIDSVKIYYLERLIKEAKEVGTEVILVVSPSWGGGKYSTEAFLKVQELANKYDVRFLTYIDSEICDNPDYFEDSAHLNDTGARKFTVEFVDDYLSTIDKKDELLQFQNTNEEYLIKEAIDLRGKTICLPKGSTLLFEGRGAIKNGTLIGNDTKIKGQPTLSSILQNVKILGTWNVPTIYSNWLDFKEGDNNTRQTKNLFSLCSSEVDNKVFISSGTYWIDSYDREKNLPGVFFIPSNTIVYNKATFKALPNGKKQSFLFYFKGVTNCTWEGGTIVGDLEKHEYNEGEQGFGIAIRGAKNVTIRNVKCVDCFGDGINLQYGGKYGHNENILIEGVTCNRNRRQGVSIEDGINVTVKNSSFSETGSYRGHLPMNAIDIEPCYKEARIQNIIIEGCKFINNKGGGLNFSCLKQEDSSIVIRNIEDINGRLRFNNCRLSNNNSGIIVSGYKCKTGKLQFKRNVRNVRLENCCFMSTLNETSNKDSLSNISMNKVTFNTAEPRTWNYYCLALVCASMRDVRFTDCVFEVTEGSKLTSVIASGGDWSGAQMRHCKIIEHRRNRLYIPCDVIDSQIECSSEISFICSKETEPLLFRDNKVVIDKQLKSGPFIFHNSPNPNYEITGNTIKYDGYFDENSLIRRCKTNRTSPVVNLYNNRFTRSHQ